MKILLLLIFFIKDQQIKLNSTANRTRAQFSRKYQFVLLPVAKCIAHVEGIIITYYKLRLNLLDFSI